MPEIGAAGEAGEAGMGGKLWEIAGMDVNGWGWWVLVSFCGENV